MQVKIKKLNENAVIPSYAKDGDACFDLTATSIKVKFEYIQYGTGLAMEIPEGHVGIILPRSSVTNKDLMLKNSLGIIDAGYRGEICFRYYKLINAPWSVIYKVGERVGQMMILPVPKIQLVEVDELTDSERGDGGYGSTGK